MTSTSQILHQPGRNLRRYMMKRLRRRGGPHAQDDQVIAVVAVFYCLLVERFGQTAADAQIPGYLAELEAPRRPAKRQGIQGDFAPQPQPLQDARPGHGYRGRGDVPSAPSRGVVDRDGFRGGGWSSPPARHRRPPDRRPGFPGHGQRPELRREVRHHDRRHLRSCSQDGPQASGGPGSGRHRGQESPGGGCRTRQVPLHCPGPTRECQTFARRESRRIAGALRTIHRGQAILWGSSQP